MRYTFLTVAYDCEVHVPLQLQLQLQLRLQLQLQGFVVFLCGFLAVPEAPGRFAGSPREVIMPLRFSSSPGSSRKVCRRPP